MAYPFDPCVDLNFMRNAYVGSNGNLHVTGKGSRVLTHTRAGSAWYFDKDGVLQAAAANVPRLDWDPTTLQLRGLLLEEARTNGLRNNSMTGVAVGSPGTMPTNWNTNASPTNGLSSNIVSSGTEDGIPYVDLRLSGTATASSNWVWNFEGNGTGPAAAAAQTWTTSAFVRLIAGTTTGMSAISLQTVGTNGVSGTESGTTSITTATSAALRTQRFTNTLLLANGTTTNVISRVLAAYTNTGVIDITLRVGAPQLELGAFVTSPILTTTVAVTRAQGVMTAPLPASFRQAHTELVEARIDSFYASPTGAPVELNDGVTARDLLYVTSSSVAIFTNTGTNTSISSTMTAGTPFKVAGSFAPGRQAGVFGGGSVGGTVAAGTTAALPVVTRIQLGTNLTPSQPFNGWLRRVRLWPRIIPDAGLAALVR